MSWWEEPWRDSAADAGRSLPGAGGGAGAGAGGPAFLFVAAGFAGAAALRFVRTALMTNYVGSLAASTVPSKLPVSTQQKAK